MASLASFLESQKRRSSSWQKAYYGTLIVFVVLNIFIHPHEPHFTLDAYPGFWAVFGIVVGMAMVYVMKRIIQPLIVRKEDYYGDI
jgi:NADH:ubiquinone oxidoreductase subunit 3 (subunit A)